ncbi:cell division protein FtsQ/DivIB [Granulicoccus sp. GXG6511]|uniref:cell division protein FtsQ/DivIB n=1 Tax=Granulicoccus sp. GXG6511 TaxID=3381351 RepID=UPI003D7CF680
MKLQDLRGRIASRSPEVTRRRRLLLLIALPLVVVVTGVLVWLFAFSSVFVLRDVTVEGTAVLTPEEVLDRAEAPVGLPLARVDERAVGERVAQLPAVREVNVRRNWPNTLDIRVTERAPVFAVGSGDSVLLVDEAGAVFPGPHTADVPEGDGPIEDPRLLSEVATVVQALPPDLRARAERVSFSSHDSISVHLSEEIEVFFGSAEQAELKGEVALALIRGTQAKHIDVSAPTRPSTR